MPILKITIGLVFGMAVIAYVNDPNQATGIATTIVEMMFTIGGAIRHAAFTIFNMI